MLDSSQNAFISIKIKSKNVYKTKIDETTYNGMPLSKTYDTWSLNGKL